MTILTKSAISLKYVLKELSTECLSIWGYGGTSGKFLTTFIMSSISFPIWTLFEKYIFNDWEFFGFWAVAINADLITGIWKHLKTQTFSTRLMLVKFLEKVGLSLFALVLFNSLSWLMNAEEGGMIKTYWTFIGRATIFFYVSFSAFENMYEISGGKFPPVGWMKRLKKFNETGNISDIKDDTKN